MNSSKDKEHRALVSDTELCNGVKDCPLGDDESDCPNRFPCVGMKPGHVNIDLDKTCDGIPNCKDLSDESEELCGDSRFHCLALGGKRVNIAKELVCDFSITCDDGSDEKNCSDGRFYCENGDPLFVRERQKFDHRGDCSDWSDECPMVDQSETRNIFSSRYELIANPILRALVWIMGILSLVGNAVVIVLETRKLTSQRKAAAGAIANRLLVLNLATSDFLMGIYLIALGIAGATMQGVYCSQDLQWRSSSSCVALGVLAVVSSETSVATMIMLTSCRLYAILLPFKSASRPQKRVVGLMILSTWAISLTIALVPLAPQLSGIFVSHAQFHLAPYFRNVQTPLDAARETFKNLLTYDLKPNVTIPAKFSVDHLSWEELQTYSRIFFNRDHFKIDKMFGYYSINSVCISKFFTTTSDRAWGFSFFVNLFNFCAFMFVATSYVAIYFKSVERTAVQSNGTAIRVRKSVDKSSAGLHHKILRLVITDCCCWMPICVLAFIKLGGVYVPNTAYVVAAIVLLPINSALNPLLYSDLPELICRLVCPGNNVTSTTQSSPRAQTRTLPNSHSAG